ncbi:hypothetical protein [Deefgea sp. CFH1-16]|uniref:hypothetical protein n=1 Tax=Deefgea sp. CFH1-16 TaxID=2675457 RepID=UPI0015F66BE9|nr:hypothetical protein [Deefgea sp. CFH1-16]MBM5575810.1 hypothetical protein [Deefgea sp. CFH1-16]
MPRFDSPLSQKHAHRSAEIHNHFKASILRILQTTSAPLDLVTLGFRARVTPSRLTGALSELADQKRISAKKIYLADQKKTVRVYSLINQLSTSAPQ